jgi:DNA replication and repair protein RecF
VAAARRALVGRLDQAGAATAAGFPAARLALIGEVDGWLDALPALAVEERMKEALAASRRHDAEAGGAAVGPQRSDLTVRERGRDVAAASCSTGEQKALLIGIVLANARLLAADRGVAPLLLLDEIAAHLDPARRAALYAELRALGAQAWLTGTDAGLFAPLAGHAQFLAVGNGTAVPTPPPVAP